MSARIHIIVFVWALVCVLAGLKAVGFRFAVVGGVILSAMLHEAARVAIQIKVGIEPEEVCIWPFGGITRNSGARSTQEEVMVRLGPNLAFLVLLLVWQLIGWWSFTFDISSSSVDTRYNWWQNYCGYMSGVQLWLLFVNIAIPAYPFDISVVLTRLLSNAMSGMDSVAMTCVFITFIMSALFLVGAILYTDTLLYTASIWGFLQCIFIMKLVSSGDVESHPQFTSDDSTVSLNRDPRDVDVTRVRAGQNRVVPTSAVLNSSTGGSNKGRPKIELPQMSSVRSTNSGSNLGDAGSRV